MAEELDDFALSAVETDPLFVGAVEDALSGPPTPVDDPDRAVGGDPRDFAGLYIRHRSSFAHHARRFLRDPRDVDEVVQEAFLRLFLALPELETELQALSYCRRTVTNLCIDRYRADKRRPRLVNIEALPVSDFPDEELDDPVVQAEDAAFVREALALLTPLHRDALVKREIEEKSIPVIAHELGVPEESVKHLLHRARRALRRHLAKTHLAPGADLEATSTLALLARSAVSGGGRMGVVVLFVVLGLVGVKQDLPATALTSWPLDLLPPSVTHALSAKPVVAPPRPAPSRARAGRATLPAPAAPQNSARVAAAAPAVTTASPSPSAKAAPSPQPLAAAAPAVAASPSAVLLASARPSASPVAAPLTSGTPSPSPEPTTALPAGSPRPSPSPSASVSASPTASASASPSSTASPSASPTPVRARALATPASYPAAP